MKIFRRFLLWLAISVAAIVVAAYAFDVDYLFKAVRTIYFNGHKTAFLDDYKYFDNRKIEAEKPRPWALAHDYNRRELPAGLAELNKETGTVAFLVIQNDSIVSEDYYDGYDASSISNSFSMAKSIVSAALGKAIMDGKIKSLSQPVADFYPEFENRSLTVGDLSSMSSGLDWDENYYSPFSVTTRAYFDPDLQSVILRMKQRDPAGKAFTYLSGNTQLLAMVIQKATGRELSSYVSDNFWKPMGAQPALWQTDSNGGMVKAFCCIAAGARDFARFGKLYLDHGKWDGSRILDSSFVAKSVVPRFDASPQYGYGWWLSQFRGKQVFYMRGHLGQYTIVVPHDKLIIVRLGHKHIRSSSGNPHSDDFFDYLKYAYEVI